MPIAQWHEIFKVIFIALAGMLVGVLAGYHLLHKFAEITYKKAHKTSQTVQKSNSSEPYCTVIYNIDSKNKTLQEVQAERRLMKGALVNG